MPTITCPRDSFCRLLNEGAPNGAKTYNTTDEIDELCFEYGLELDEDVRHALLGISCGRVTSNLQTSVRKEATDPPPKEPFELKIEVPANRYDLLCLEGIIRALRIYLEYDNAPAYLVSQFDPATCYTAVIRKDTQRVRPYFAAAVLRNLSFTQESYDSFIDLQDKLHQNLARKRTLVAIGTHDLDTIAKGDIHYDARPPKEIRFTPLNKTVEMDAAEMMEYYQANDKHIARYLHIIRDSPVYPIIYDSAGTVLSMPPIINGDHTKITLRTRNVFFDLTATDPTKLAICCNILVTMFAQYAAEPFVIEPVRLRYEADGREEISPNVTLQPMRVNVSYLNSCTALALTPKEQCRLLNRMGNAATPSLTDPDLLDVLVPPTRPDNLHKCDLVEDMAIAYGFNRLQKTFPSTNTVAKALPINKVTDIVRQECAACGFVEALPLILCSHDENFRHLNRHDDKTMAVVLANPKTAEYQVVRTSLLPGLLKTARENQSRPKPIRIFEVSDVSLKDPKDERRARNERRVAALYCDRTGNFEAIHGLLDRVMLVLGIKWLKDGSSSTATGPAYYISGGSDSTFLPGRAASLHFRPPSDAPDRRPRIEEHAEDPAVSQIESTVPLAKAVKLPDAATARQQPNPLDTLKSSIASVLPSRNEHTGDILIGSLGILHPSVLKAFDIPFPISAVEFVLEGL